MPKYTKKISLCGVSNIMVSRVSVPACVHVSAVLRLGRSGQSGSVREAPPQQGGCPSDGHPRGRAGFQNERQGCFLQSGTPDRLFFVTYSDSQAVESCYKQNPNPTEKTPLIDPVHST